MFKHASKRLFGDFETDNKECLVCVDTGVYFLVSRRGDAIECHVAAENRQAKRNLRDACAEFVRMVPIVYPWCKMLIAPVAMKSVYNLCINLGFQDAGVAEFERGPANIMVIDYE